MAYTDTNDSPIATPRIGTSNPRPTTDGMKLRDGLLDLPLGPSRPEDELEPEAARGDGPQFDPLPDDDADRAYPDADYSDADYLDTDDLGDGEAYEGARSSDGRYQSGRHGSGRHDSRRHSAGGRGLGIGFVVLALLLAAGAGAAVWFLKPQPAVLTPSLEMIDFLAVPLSDDARRSFEVGNSGEARLDMLRTELGGADAGDFAIAGDDCSGVRMTTEDRCLIEVIFRPTAAGRRAATLTLVGDAINAPVTLPLLGTGTAAELRVDPAVSTFTPALMGTASRPQRVRAANRGTTALPIGDAILEGLAAGDFAIRDDTCSGRTLQPNAECMLMISFLPTRDGPRRATLWLRGAGSEQAASVGLEGTGLTPEPRLRLTVERVELGVQPVGEAGEGRTFAIANDGSAPLTLDDITLEGPDAERFVVDAAACTGAPIPAGGACEVAVSVSPVEIGPLMATVTVAHDGGRGEVALSATGIAPQVRLVPLRIGLGESAVAQRSDGSALRVENVGMAPLRIATVRLDGGDAGAFFVGNDGCGGRTLASGEACSVRVGVKPQRPGPLRSSLKIAHNAGRESVPLTAFGVAGRLVADVAALDYADVAQGQDRTRRVVLTNRGRARLSVRPPRLEGGDRQHFQIAESTCTSPLAPGESCSVSVAFLPRAPGPRRTVLLLDHDGEGETLRVTLAGRAAPPPRARVETSPGRVDFGSRPVGSRGEIETVTLRNVGNASFELLDVRLVGLDAGDFQIVPGSCAGATFVAASGSCTVGVRFTPSLLGPREASLEIEHRGEGTRSLVLVGEGF